MTLYVKTTGDGPDVVLLHGWGIDSGIWSELIRVLAPRYRVHALDLPGYGASATRDSVALETMAQQAARSAPRRCAVCGWSLGGQVALAWARRAPRQVTRLALIATTPCFAQRDGWPHAVKAETLREFAQALTADYEGTLKRFLALQAWGDAQAKEVARRLQETVFARGHPSAAVLRQGLQILLDADLRPQLSAITQPALILHGDRDRLTPPAAGEYLSRRLPHARLTVVHGAGHAPFVSNPQGVGALLAEFLDGK